MKMRLSDLQKKILTAIKTKLSHKDLCNLCIYNDLPSSGLKRSIQERLELSIQSQSYTQLMIINTKVDEYINGVKKVVAPIAQLCQEIPAYDNSVSNYKPDTLSDASLSQAPIKLDEELAMIDRNSIVVIQFTTYPSAQTAVPTQTITGINERILSVRIPSMYPYVPVQISPFYCCTTCLHPLSLLVPQTMPNIPHNNKITSHSSIQFSLSDDACKLITRNCQTSSAGKKIDFKWQVLLRFVAVDPTLSMPTPGQAVTQYMPPYLNVTVNNENIPLWEILPSNSRMKDGKRHPKPINITDKLNVICRLKNCYRQNILIDWWQTPGIFQYYYVGVYLERKLSVREILDLFTSDRHVNIHPIEATLALIKSKLNDANRNNDEDDDLVVSSVLPISLSCPVGRSRIEIPIRTLNCQHLQCFDANIFLCMNERRSIWKCPVCEASATPNELFCDKYFQEILQEFKDTDSVNDINVNSDGTYVPVSAHNKDEKVDPDKKCADGTVATASTMDAMIVLDSDDEGDSLSLKLKSPLKSTPANKFANNTTKKMSQNNSVTQKIKQSQKPMPPKINQSAAASNIFKAVDISLANTVATATATVDNQMDTSEQTPSSKAIATGSVTIGPSHIRITAPLSSSSTHMSPRPTIPLSSNSFAIPPPTFMSHPIASRSSMSVVQTLTPPASLFATPPPALPTLTSSLPLASPLSSIPTPIVIPTPSIPSAAAKKMFEISSLIQSPNLASTRTPIAAPHHEPIPTPLSVSLMSPIPAPNEVSSVLAAVATAVTPLIPSTLSSALSSSLKYQKPKDSTSRDSSFSLASSPMNSTAYESNFKIKRSQPTLNGTFQSVIESLTADIHRTPNDVIRTPPTNIISAPDKAAANFVTQPVCCPAIILDKPQPTKNDVTDTAFTKPQETRRESMKRTKAVVTQPPTGIVSIPAVSIDLTDDDDEEPCIVAGNAIANHNATKGSQIKWCNMNDAPLRNNQIGTVQNRFAMPDRQRMIQRTVNNNNISHYKTHRVEFSAQRSANGIVGGGGLPNKAIDLTGDDDDDDGDSGAANSSCPALKRPRIAVIEDGQINDSDDDSLSSLAASSSSSTSSSVDSVKKHSAKFLGHAPMSSSIHKNL